MAEGTRGSEDAPQTLTTAGPQSQEQWPMGPDRQKGRPPARPAPGLRAGENPLVVPQTVSEETVRLSALLRSSPRRSAIRRSRRAWLWTNTLEDRAVPAASGHMLDVGDRKDPGDPSDDRIQRL